MEKKISFSEILKKYTMVIVLVFVVIMFSVNTKGVMLLPQNVNNLVAQNAYVFILATGMLFCILTGGNIDLSVGSVVCFVAAVGGKMMVLNSMNPYLTMIVMVLVGIAIGAWQGFWIAYVRIPPVIVSRCLYGYPAIYCYSGRYACFSWPVQRSSGRTDPGPDAGCLSGSVQ